MQDGWIKLWRQLLESEVWKDSDLLRLFIWCLLKARHKESRNPNDPKIGEFDTTNHVGADGVGCSKSAFYKRLKRLEELGCITINGKRSLTRVSVCNYLTYQGSVEDEGNAEETLGKREGNAKETLTLDSKNERMKERARTCPEFDPLVMQLPPSLDTPAFRSSWSEWIEYRQERRLSCREKTITKQLEMLGRLSESSAILSIEESIRNGWQGLFEPKVTSNGHSQGGDLFGSLRRFMAKGEGDGQD